MQHRQIGRTGIDISTLGFGTMRFKGRDNAAEIIARGLELGLNYFDLGAAYCFQTTDENSESWTGAAIAGIPREQLVLSSKAHTAEGEAQVEKALVISTRDQMWQCIENSLQRVGVAWFDFYQIWGMNDDAQYAVGCQGPNSPLQAIREAKEQGLVKHIGFTSHGQVDTIIRWLQENPDFEFITVYYNFSDRAPERAVEYAREHGVGVAIMGPLRGGVLTGKSTAFARALPELAELPVQELALRFLLSNPAVTTVLSGMNEVAHLEENARVADLEAPLTADQRQRFIAAFQEFSKGETLCSGCRYCMGACPEGLYIPQAMALWQLHEVFEMENAAHLITAIRGKERHDPTRCVACGTCVDKCPQRLPIPQRMARLAAIMDQLCAEEAAQ